MEEQLKESMSSRMILNSEIDSFKNIVDELRNKNDELNSTIVNTKSEINTLEFTLSQEISKASDLSNAIIQQKSDYEKQLFELNDTLVRFIIFFSH